MRGAHVSNAVEVLGAGAGLDTIAGSTTPARLVAKTSHDGVQASLFYDSARFVSRTLICDELRT